MKKLLLCLVLTITLIYFSGCTTKIIEDSKPNIAVSIIPQESFVKAVGGDLVHVTTMIPPGNSPTNYQPTPMQIIDFSEADLYFTIGVPAEQANILPKALDLNKDIKIVSLADKTAAVYPHRVLTEEDSDEEGPHTSHTHVGTDPHIWLSPKRVMVMIDAIKDELILLDSENKSIYEKNAADYIAQLKSVDNEIVKALSNLNQKSFIIYHPAFGYFADDYGLEMVTIEADGKETTLKRIQDVINYARSENIKVVFYQEEFDGHQAEIIANEIGGATIQVAPLSPDYIENLKSITDTFKEVLQ